MSLWDHLKKMPAGVPRSGPGRWFQLLEDRFMKLFWANLVWLLCMVPFLSCLFFAVQAGGLPSVAGAGLSWMLAGPANTYLSFVAMQVVRGRPVWVWQDFADCLRAGGLRSMGFAAVTGLLWGGLLWAVRLVIAVQGGLGPLYALAFLCDAFVLTGITFFGHQQLAMLRLPFAAQLKNAFLLIFAGGARSFAAVAFLLAALGAGLCLYRWFVFVLLLGLPAIVVMTGSLIFYPVFARLFAAGGPAAPATGPQGDTI